MTTDAALPPPAAARPNPYVGPRALESGEALFGRDDETIELLNRVIADRVVMLYAVSGAGKSSLLKAGLLPGMESRRLAPLPIVQVRDEPPAGFAGNRYTLSAIDRFEAARTPGDGAAVPDARGLTLEKYLEARFPAGLAGRVLVFDQFEDVLRIDPTDTPVKDEFFRDVGRVLRKDGVRAVFSLREEYVAGLDPYLRHLPTQLSSRFRLGLLEARAAREAVCGPAAAAGVPFRDDTADELVGQLRLTRVQRLDGRAVEQKLGPTVEPVQLQVVCQLVWDRLPAGAAEVGPAALEGFSVDQALEQYFAAKVEAAARDAKVDESRVRLWVEKTLITEQRLRGQVLKGSDTTDGLPNAAVEGLVAAYVVRAEQRLGGTWFELTHDRLVDPIRQNNRAWFAPRLRPFQHQADEFAARPPAGRDDLLLKGPALNEAEGWAAANPTELRPADKTFLDESRKVRTATDRIKTAFYRGWAVLSTVALCVGALLLAWAVVSHQKADSNFERAEKQAVEAKESQGRAEEAKRDADREKDNALTLAAKVTESSALLKQNTQMLAERNAAERRARRDLDIAFLRQTNQLASQSSKLATAKDRETILLAGFAWESLYSFFSADDRPRELTQLAGELKRLHGLPNAEPDYGALRLISPGLSKGLRVAVERSEVMKWSLPHLKAVYYGEAAEVVTMLTASKDAATDRTLRAQFEECYWVKLAMVQSPEVAGDMVGVRNALPAGTNSVLTVAEYGLLQRRGAELLTAMSRER